MTPIPMELWGTLIGFIGAVLGYAFREYRNRVVPFTQIIRIEGDYSKRSDPERVSVAIADQLTNTFYIRKFDSAKSDGFLNTPYGEIWDRFDRCDDLQRFWLNVKSDLQRIISSENDTEYLEALSRPFGNRVFERLIITSILSGRLRIPHLTSPAPREIVTAAYDADRFRGSYWLFFPSGAKNFGEKFVEVGIRTKCEPFVKLVSAVERKTLDLVFREFMALIDDEYAIAMSVGPELKNIVNKHSRWLCVMYFANLNNYPLIVENSIILEIADGASKLTFSEACELILAEEAPDGSYNFRDTPTPLVIESGASRTFGCITAKTQSEMRLGNDLRVVFDRGEASCRAVLKIQRPGLFKRQGVSTRRTPFVGAGKSAIAGGTY